MRPFILFAFLVLISCQQELKETVLTYDEMTAMVSDNTITIPKTVAYYDVDGSLLDSTKKETYTDDLPYADWVMSPDSILLRVQLNDKSRVELTRETQPIIQNDKQINCDTLIRLLAVVHDKDQRMRFDKAINPQVDKINQDLIDRIFNKCGIPTLDDTGAAGMQTIWMVVQHADSSMRARYYPRFETAVERGDMTKENLALTYDLIQRDQGKPQLYGSQVIENNDGTFKLYELKDPDKVDERRAAMSMSKLADYLFFYGINYKP